MLESRSHKYSVAILFAAATLGLLPLLPAGEARTAITRADLAEQDPASPSEDVYDAILKLITPLDPILARIAHADRVDEIDAAVDEAIDQGALQRFIDQVHAWVRDHETYWPALVHAATAEDVSDAFSAVLDPPHTSRLRGATQWISDTHGELKLAHIERIDLLALLHDPALALDVREAMFRCLEGGIAILALACAIDEEPLRADTVEHLVGRAEAAGDAARTLLERADATRTELEVKRARHALMWRASKEPMQTWPSIPEDTDHVA